MMCAVYFKWNQSVGGSPYFVTFIDNFTKFVSVHFSYRVKLKVFEN